MKAAVAGVLRERRLRMANTASDDLREREAVEAEVISLLYGDAAVRHRVFGTQPSHILSSDRRTASTA